MSRLSPVILGVALVAAFGWMSWGMSGALLAPLPVWAAEDESEDEGSEDEGSEERSESSSNADDEEETETVTRTYTVVEKVSQVVMVTPAEYLSDRDGDLLVDALDPNPDTHQREYFTDSDGDSVANAYDAFPGQDDLVTFGSETDENANGIIDRYES